MHFEFSIASRIVFGSGRINSINDLAPGHVRNIFIIHGGPGTNYQHLVKKLNEKPYELGEYKIHSEPAIDSLRILVHPANLFAPDLIIAIGGGSTIDAASIQIEQHEGKSNNTF